MPNVARNNRLSRFSFLHPKEIPFFLIIMNAKKNAIRLRKKLFCTDGKSPAIRTNMFIKAKKNAEHMMQIIPKYFLFFSFLILNKTTSSYLTTISYKITIPKVPATIRTRPTADCFVSFSLNTIYANAMETTVLNLSIGRTTLIGPSCNAR